MFEVGDIVSWRTNKGEEIEGIVLKVYETTFGSTVRDIALQINLYEKRNGRLTTTVRAKHCTKIGVQRVKLEEEPIALPEKTIPVKSAGGVKDSSGRIIVPDGTFDNRVCCVCGSTARARIYSSKYNCIDDYYCTKCYRDTKSLLPLNKKNGYKIGG